MENDISIPKWSQFFIATNRTTILKGPSDNSRGTFDSGASEHTQWKVALSMSCPREGMKRIIIILMKEYFCCPLSLRGGYSPWKETSCVWFWELNLAVLCFVGVLWWPLNWNDTGNDFIRVSFMRPREGTTLKSISHYPHTIHGQWTVLGTSGWARTKSGNVLVNEIQRMLSIKDWWYYVDFGGGDWRVFDFIALTKRLSITPLSCDL